LGAGESVWLTNGRQNVSRKSVWGKKSSLLMLMALKLHTSLQLEGTLNDKIFYELTLNVTIVSSLYFFPIPKSFIKIFFFFMKVFAF